MGGYVRREPRDPCGGDWQKSDCFLWRKITDNITSEKLCRLHEEKNYTSQRWQNYYFCLHFTSLERYRSWLTSRTEFCIKQWIKQPTVWRSRNFTLPYRLRAGKAEMSDSDFPSSEPVTMNNFKSLRMSTKKKPFFFFLVKMHLNLLLRNKFVT